MRPVGPCVVPGDVGELSLVRATLCHDIDVEGAYAVISSDEVTNIPITWPPPPQTGGRPEARATGLVACSSGPGGNGIEDGRAIGENGGVGQLDHPGPVRIHDENIFVAAVAGAVERDLLAVRRPDGVVVDETTRGELGGPGPVRVHDENMELAAVAVAREHETPAVGRPARAIALVPARVVGEPCDSTPIRVHDIDLFVAVAGADERDLLSVGRPGGRRSRAVMGQLGHPAPVYVHHVDVSVTVERDLSAIGRPGPREAVVGKHSLTAPVRVDHYDRGRATAGNPAERDLLAIRRPDGIEFVYGVVRDLGDAAAVGVHYVDIEVAVAVAMEGDPASEAFSGGQTELESVRLRGEGSFGVVTACEKSPNSEEWDQGGYHPPLRQPGRNSMAHIPSWVSAKKKPAVRVFAQPVSRLTPLEAWAIPTTARLEVHST